ncbi:EAL domain-containing protein [Pseudidiomarina gelatinasegens]|uniref:EAL domain-containing protein n=1 Tax=Pseudidiomarina gelatinasegens TaxID=2487740 RepID=A0A443Z784_9GAMM|nr:EAL domain-containing protein [Pseudidiomarina gelatinasegens]RWU12784.1 EAL domain-containing protein [Pseudidiomarina gelatinasegens]
MSLLQQHYYSLRNVIMTIVIVCVLAILVPTAQAQDWQVELINLRLANQPVSAQQLDPRNRPQLYNTEVLYVPAIQDPFSIEFGAPYAPNARMLYYRYQLEGFDRGWVYTDTEYRRATYTNLSYGNYVFKVEASYDGKTWTGTRQIMLDVAAPGWLSPWAIALYALIFLAAMVAVFFVIRARHLAIVELRNSEERLKLSLWGSGDQLWDWDIPHGTIHRHNSWRNLNEFPIDHIRSGKRGTATNIHPLDLRKVQQNLRKHLDGSTNYFEMTYRVKTDQGWMSILDRGKVVERDEHHQPIRMTGTLKDITPLVAAEERLKMLATSITNISDGVCIYDASFNVIETNASVAKITGYSREDMLGRPLALQLYSPEYIEQIKRLLNQHGSWRGEVEDLRKDGSLYQVELTLDAIRDDSDRVSHYVATFADITERKAAERELRRLSNTDTLTGLPNRSYFQVSHANLVRKRIQHALLLFDLDDFKKINDSLGHDIGDQLLLQVAERIAEVGRPQDTFFRLGGDEFVLMLEDTSDLSVITDVATQILAHIGESFHINDNDIVVGSSIGIVVYPSDGASSQELLQNADTAMYHAKNRGGHSYQFFNDSMNKNAVRRLQVENQLRQALRNKHIQVMYQPKVSLRTYEFVGLEALVRLNIPGTGVINPSEFIPLAEETGLIIEMGEQVLRQTCRDMCQWVKQGMVQGRVAVNLSAKQFIQPDLTQRIMTILREENLSPEYLELEITEGVVMEDPERAIEIMTELNNCGIHLALDDFGTGYSSLAYLKRFPIQTLKIDKAFVDDINGADRDRNMVASIVAMAHNMGLDVVAEGVVNTAQAATLSRLSCEFAQGYLFAEPLSSDAFLAHISVPASIH